MDTDRDNVSVNPNNVRVKEEENKEISLLPNLTQFFSGQKFLEDEGIYDIPAI